MGRIRIWAGRSTATISGVMVASALSVVGAPTASGATPVAGCGAVLSAAGAYELSADLQCAGAGAAITITASGVALDLKGHVLSGDQTVGGRGIVADGVGGLTITNGTVRDFQDAQVRLTGVTGSQVSSLLLTQVADAGGPAFFGLLLRAGSDDNVVTGLKVSGGFFDGIQVDDADRNVIRANTGSGIDVALALQGDSSGTLVEGNDFSHSNAYNIALYDDVVGAVVRGNRLHSAGEKGLRLASIYVQDSLFVGNSIRNNGDEGIDVPNSDLTPNVFRGNVVLGNGWATPDGVDISDERADDDICYQTYVDNVFRTDSEGDGPAAGCVQGRLPRAPAVTTSALPAASVGAAYSARLAVDGDVAPYLWSVAQGSLPAGLTLASDGQVSGTPRAAGTTSFTVRVTDDDTPAQTGTRTVSLQVAPGRAPYVCGGQGATLLGTPASDSLFGTDGPDVILGAGGLDTVNGRGGDDVICAPGAGSRIVGGVGDDVLVGGPGPQTIIALAGSDTIDARGGDDLVRAGGGRDEVRGRGGDDKVNGGRAADELVGGGGGDQLIGYSGKDLLRGGGGPDRLAGGADRDTCRGAGGTDRASGCETTAGVP